jgi:hypothetical protein
LNGTESYYAHTDHTYSELGAHVPQVGAVQHVDEVYEVIDPPLQPDAWTMERVLGILAKTPTVQEAYGARMFLLEEVPPSSFLLGRVSLFCVNRLCCHVV